MGVQLLHGGLVVGVAQRKSTRLWPAGRGFDSLRSHRCLVRPPAWSSACPAETEGFNSPTRRQFFCKEGAPVEEVRRSGGRASSPLRGAPSARPVQLPYEAPILLQGRCAGRGGASIRWPRLVPTSWGPFGAAGSTPLRGA